MADKLYAHLLQMLWRKILLKIFASKPKISLDIFIMFVVILKCLSYLKFVADGQIFNFPKLFQYGILSQPTRGLL